MPRLSSAALAQLEIPTPTYDRSAASVGIVHFGVGNFHRSHQAVYLDQLMQGGSALDWGICGVGVLPQDSAMRDVMHAQDCLFTVVVRHPDGTLEPRVVGSLLEYLLAPDDPEAVFTRLVDPDVRLVTLTVTEGGYLKNAATGLFDVADPAVQHDVAHVATPRTAFGYVVEGLRRRRDVGHPPFTVLSCDNLQGNGDVTRQTVVGLARRIDPSLADWIDEAVTFPSCMVDRITPATTDADRDALASEFDVSDAWPVPAEPFTQWIVEDHFPLGRPPLEEVGVQLVDDVGPYELMKLRLLNASHQAIAYLGAPLGYTLVDEAMRDDLVRAFLERYMAEEAAPTLGPLPGIDLDAYMATLVERFANPGIRDTLVRLATDGGNRMATFTLPTVRANLEAGRPVELGAVMCAAWAEYWALIARGGLSDSEVPPDVHADALASAASDGDASAFLEQRDLFGDLADDERFSQPFLRARAAIVRRGLRATLVDLLGS
ncbi:mannitol dehydrogenase family protein [Angustibacter sp. Root456]|uniref:mannitol dehydrogenase family protein n=1 Tax=Angustibacter sp. Root456 TaxID=1736539 RepID=UPI0007021D21|nr:mannitol dehydrogenase family protein [Angustibacter sp. Root456]KQX69776.1 mannitol dehydrogenase [Angustibacter sp. Root456]